MIGNLESVSKANPVNNYTQRLFICPCGKSYLSYPALFTHIKQKHDGKPPGEIIRPQGSNKRGRPKKKAVPERKMELIDLDSVEEKDKMDEGRQEGRLGKTGVQKQGVLGLENWNSKLQSQYKHLERLRQLQVRIGTVLKEVVMKFNPQGMSCLRNKEINQIIFRSWAYRSLLQQSFIEPPVYNPTLQIYQIPFGKGLTQFLGWCRGSLRAEYLIHVELFLSVFVECLCEASGDASFKIMSISEIFKYYNYFYLNYIPRKAQQEGYNQMGIIQDSTCLSKWMEINGLSCYKVQIHPELTLDESTKM